MSTDFSTRRLRVAAGAVLATSLIGAAVAAPAEAASAWSTSGVTGAVVESSAPATCYNSGYGYYVTAGGPSISAVRLTNGETSQSVRWVSVVVDATNGSILASDTTGWYTATTTRPVTFGNWAPKVGHRGDVIYVENYAQWYSPSYGSLIGTKGWNVSCYAVPDQGRYASHC